MEKLLNAYLRWMKRKSKFKWIAIIDGIQVISKSQALINVHKK